TRRRAEPLARTIEQTWEARRLEGYAEMVTGVALCPDGKHAIWCGNDGRVGLWDVQSGKEVRAFATVLGKQFAVAVSPDGKRALSGENGAATLWDVKTRQALHTLRGHAAAVISVAFSADGKQALTGSND